jgi:hypothetical protein
MVNRQRLSLTLYLFTALLVIILLSAGLSKLDFQSGEPGNILGLLSLFLQNLTSIDSGSPPPIAEDNSSVEWIVPVFWVMLIFSLAYALVSPKLRRQLLRTLFFVVVLLLLADQISGRLQETDVASELEAGTGASESTDIDVPVPPPFVSDPPNWFLVAVNVLLVLLIPTAVWFFWRLLRPKPDTQALLVQEAESALTDLEAGGDLRNVVLRCYAEMSQVLRRSRNIRRRKAMTPREFEQHLAELGLRDDHIQRLTQLFEGIRYGARTTGGRAEREAMDCLRAIVQAYGNTL